MAEKKSRGKSRPGLFEKGGRQGPGRGPKKGAPNAGRPSDEFKAFMSSLVKREDVRKGIADILTDPKMAYDPARSKLYLDAFKFAAEHAHGKPTQTVEASGEVGLKVTFG